MKHILFFLFLSVVFLQPMSADAQRRIYFNAQWELVKPNSGVYYRECFVDTTTMKFVGNFTDYNIDGTKNLTGSYVDGKKSGLFRSYHTNGRIQYQGRYEQDVRVGQWDYFYEDGRIHQEVIFSNDDFQIVTFNDSTGNTLVRNGTGRWYEYFTEYKTEGMIRNEGSFLDGKKNGVWVSAVLNNGAVQELYRETYKNGKFVKGMILPSKANIVKEFRNKMLPHFRHEIIEKWKAERGVTSGDYPFIPSLPASYDNRVFTVVEKPAEFPGGREKMHEYIRRNLTYPAEARKARQTGTVFVGFIIEIDGSISDVTTVKGISDSLNAEALRLVSQMPSWIPGEQNGAPVRTKFVLPIKFNM